MPVRLFVTKDKETSDPEVYTFDQDTVIIGRERTVDLTLDDPDQVISGKHVEITCSETDYQIVDRSTNGTRLNDVEMERGRVYPLHHDDHIGIIKYQIRVELFAAEPPTEPEPPVAPEREQVLANDSLNEAVGQLAEALDHLSRAYDEAPDRDEALQSALNQILVGVKDHKAILQVAQALDTVTGTGALPASSQTQTRLDKLVDVMLQSIPDLTAIADTFQLEFLDWTRPRHTEFNTAEGLKTYLFDPTITQEEADRRAERLQAELHKLQAHFFGMLNGYRVCVRHGTERLLEAVDPQTLERSLARDHRLYRLVPVLRRLRMVNDLKQKHRLLAARNWARAEEDLFRPAFCEGYTDVLDAARERDRE